MLPLPRLDDRTYEQLVEDARKKIPSVAPGWTDHNAHDPGMTFIELFSWLSELQHYYLDQIRDVNELKFLKLIGQMPQTAQSAVTDVTFAFNDGNNMNAKILIPKSTPLTTEDNDVVFETKEPLLATSVKLKKVIGIDPSGAADHSDANGREGLYFHAFGQGAEAGNKLYLGFNDPFPADEPISITFHLFEDYPIARGVGANGSRRMPIHPSAMLEWEYFSAANGGNWSPLIVISDNTRMLSCSGRLVIRAPGDSLRRTVDRLKEDLIWIRATVRTAGYELSPLIDRILLNTVSAVQRVTILDEIAGSSNGLPGQYFDLAASPVLPKSMKLQVYEETNDLPKWIDWKQVDSLDASGPKDKHYVLQPETGRILFGDGINGAIPKPASSSSPGIGSIMVSRYQTSSGDKGNVGAHTITRWLRSNALFSSLTVDNVIPAVGGTDSESLTNAMIRARKQLRLAHSAATSEDYETLALSTPGLRVARAKAIPNSDSSGTSSPGTVTVVVVPYSEYANPMPSKGFLDNVCRHLHPHRLLTTRLCVVPPVYVKSSAEAGIRIKPGYDAEAVRQRAVAALLRFMHPLTGGADGTGWSFGRAIYLSEIYDVIGRVQGVDCVHQVRMTASGKGIRQDAEGNVMIPPRSLVYSDSHLIEVVSAEADCGPYGGCYGDKRGT